MDLNDKKQLPQKNRRYSDSFRYAFEGVKTTFQEERNMRTHVMAGAIALLLGVFLSLSITEWLWILLASFLVFVMEILNTVIENLVDLVTQEYHPLAKKVKDMAAAAVLSTTVFSVVTGLLIFAPKLLNLFF
ncbi:diacylglycerol kinase family protein [Marinilactibacillus sp. Marseille-P9653]|uniref:diacylglycerol kinase family protein n=1 Tax=Marinilactibacillus sp. Marseille-P9653 TaxID=2866583 RepID=UPI001CE4B350|nr:diacylglycerol kinase family protein [Marinilactibacillus sp. Marseille-P9653]